MDEQTQLSNTRRMLERAACLYDGCGSVEREDFNIFSVLRAESDEVNLHSRFLAALLRHRKSRDAPLRNLEDFLRAVVEIDDFRLDGVEIERERHGIDILIRNPTSVEGADPGEQQLRSRPRSQRSHARGEGLVVDEILERDRGQGAETYSKPSRKNHRQVIRGRN